MTTSCRRDYDRWVRTLESLLAPSGAAAALLSAGLDGPAARATRVAPEEPAGAAGLGELLRRDLCDALCRPGKPPVRFDQVGPGSERGRMAVEWWSNGVVKMHRRGARCAGPGLAWSEACGRPAGWPPGAFQAMAAECSVRPRRFDHRFDHFDRSFLAAAGDGDGAAGRQVADGPGGGAAPDGGP